MKKFSITCRIVSALGAAFIILIISGIFNECPAKKYPEEHFGVEGTKKGPRSIENIQATMNLIMPRIYYLYAQSQAGMSLREGNVLMWLVIDKTGRITYVSVFETTLNDELFEDVLEATLADINFGKWKKGSEKTEVIYPLEFRKEQSLAAPKSRARKAWDNKRQTQRTTDSLIQSLINQVDKPAFGADSASNDTTGGPVYHLESDESRSLMKKP
jgi:hypothetical protein